AVLQGVAVAPQHLSADGANRLGREERRVRHAAAERDARFAPGSLQQFHDGGWGHPVHPPRQYPPAIHVGIHQSRSRNSEPNPIRRPKTAEFEFEFDPDTEHRIPNTEYRIPKPLSTLELGADDP